MEKKSKNMLAIIMLVIVASLSVPGCTSNTSSAPTAADAGT